VSEGSTLLSTCTHQGTAVLPAVFGSMLGQPLLLFVKGLGF
jgi:hypothetical protein